MKSFSSTLNDVPAPTSMIWKAHKRPARMLEMLCVAFVLVWLSESSTLKYSRITLIKSQMISKFTY